MTEDRSTEAFPAYYDEAFVRRCHEIVLLGYERLDAAQLVDLDEPAITGKLVAAMKEALDSPSAPGWAILFTACEEQPESVRGLSGKRRPVVDIAVDRINPRPSSTFRFEAKRLGERNPVGDYLGDDGMLALIDGYYGDLEVAGMLGYVQSKTCAGWSALIKDRILADAAKYRVVTPVAFIFLTVPAPEPIFASIHNRLNNQKQFLTHTILNCC